MHDKIIDYIENKEGDNFKQTEIGLIPEDWEVVKLGGYLELLRNGTTKKQNKDGIGYPITRIETIADARIDSERVGYINNFSKSEAERYLMEIEDILLSHINSEPHLGKTAIYEGFPPTLIHGMNLLLIRAKRCFLNSYFLNFLFNFYRLKGIFINLASRAVGQSSINQGKIKALQISLPPLPEQEKIARVLSKIKQAIEQQDKIIDATKNLKKSLMQRLFTEGVINGFMFDTNIFGHMLDNKILVENFPENLNFFITHIQLYELKKTRDQNRRNMLLTIFNKIDQENIPTESTVLGVSKLGYSKLSRKNNIYEKIKSYLDEKLLKQNNKQDALIAETAIKNGLILVTDDSDLLEVTQKYNGEVITLKDFLSGNYRKVKETEIGLIPKSWEVVRLGGYLELLRNGTTKKQNKDGLGYPVTRIETIADARIDSERVGYINNFSKSEVERYLMEKEDILLSHINSEPHLGKSAIYEGFPPTLIHGMNLLLIRAKRCFLNSYFLNYLFNFYRLKGIFINLASRAVGQSSINQGKIKALQIPLPPLPEQQEITNILSTLGKKIEVEESRKSILKELFKTMLHKLMTGEIRLKDINI